MRELNTCEIEAVNGGIFSWGGLGAATFSGMIIGGTFGAAAGAGVGAGPGALAGGLGGGGGYLLDELFLLYV